MSNTTNEDHERPARREPGTPEPGITGPGDAGPIDPRFEKLVALLYDELPANEASSLRREIDADPTLRGAWVEISTARVSLGALAFEDPQPAPAWVPIGVPRPAPPVPRPRRRLRLVLAGGGWGLAAAALLLLALGLTHFRVERIENGLAFRVGASGAPERPMRPADEGSIARSDQAPITRSNQARDSRPDEPAIAFSDQEGSPHSGQSPFALSEQPLRMSPDNPRLTPAGDTPVTRSDLRAYTTELSRSLAILLDDRATRRDAEMASWLQVAFEEMSRRQARDYGDLRGRIEEVGIGLARGQVQTDERMNLLLRQTREEQPPALIPATQGGDTP